jgi:FtsP/CotA-like multicopper oxidase with cupredoxin domain
MQWRSRKTCHSPTRGWFLLALALGVVHSCLPMQATIPRVVPNDNRVPGGMLQGGVLVIHLEVREGRWFPDGDNGASGVMPMFAEEGQPPRNPGPLIRVPEGTVIRATVRNALRDSTLILVGLSTRPGRLADSIHVPAGARRQVSFLAGAPGTYFYWGTTTDTPVQDRSGIDSQLHGAFIVDAAGQEPPPDRVFVLGSWTSPSDSGIAPELRVINGLSWPHTERFTYTAGDTVRWRWVNPTDSPHPMHLHGFYFDVTSRGTWAADTMFGAARTPAVVTEMPLPGGTFAMRWVPDEPGNWLMHCHVAFHMSRFLSFATVPDVGDPLADDSSSRHTATHTMRGMVLAITVQPGASTARRVQPSRGARELRLVAQPAPRRFRGQLDELAFVLQQGDAEPAADSVPSPSSPLILVKGEPVRVTIVNHLRFATGVHWHGIEVPAIADGVGGWSGAEGRVAPMIAPGDSFVAAFTPPRAGTFMYHAHSNETFQISLGLYGALLVVDPARHRPANERLVMLGADGPTDQPKVNGKVQPDTLRLVLGTTYRLRLIHIFPDWTALFTLRRGDSTLEWRSLAKDGRELPPEQQSVTPASLLAGPGETMDYEFTPMRTGMLRLDIAQRQGLWKTSVWLEVRGRPPS